MKRAFRPGWNPRRGLASLAEMLVGIVLVAGTLLIVLGLFPSAYGSLIQAKSMTQATNLARLVIERQKSSPYGLVVAIPAQNQEIDCTVGGRPVNQTFVYSLDIQSDPSNLDRFKDLTVTVAWNSGGASASGLKHTVVLQTEIPNW